jgi:hypothetical protein
LSIPLGRPLATVRTILQLLDAIGLRLFLGGQPIGLASYRSKTSGRFLRLNSTEKAARLTETLGCPARLGRILRVCRGATHIVLRLSQPIQRLLRRLLRRPRSRVAAGLPILPALSLLPTLSELAALRNLVLVVRLSVLSA